MSSRHLAQANAPIPFSEYEKCVAQLRNLRAVVQHDYDADFDKDKHYKWIEQRLSEVLALLDEHFPDSGSGSGVSRSWRHLHRAASAFPWRDDGSRATTYQQLLLESMRTLVKQVRAGADPAQPDALRLLYWGVVSRTRLRLQKCADTACLSKSR